MTKIRVPTVNKIQVQISKAMDEILKLDPQRTNIETQLESSTTDVLNQTPSKSTVDTKIVTFNNDVSSSFKTASQMSTYDDKINNYFKYENVPLFRFMYPVNTICVDTKSELSTTLLNSLFPSTSWYLNRTSGSYNYYRRGS